ncbi:MAG TPA: hypothetical protein VMT85_11435 [Thermoanaerobaculia bacterium]|nr:hypothetical protein [Thermoanaerobaculia bacterium]
MLSTKVLTTTILATTILTATLTTTMLSVAPGAGGAPGPAAGAIPQEPLDRAAIDRATIEREVMAVLDAFMAGFNAMDMEGWEGTFHFPHYRLAAGGMNVLEGPGLRDGADLKRRLEATGWHHSAWERREIVHLGRDKAHVDTRFVRYRADGSVLAAYDSLYVLTREDGTWRIKLRSSFAP